MKAKDVFKKIVCVIINIIITTSMVIGGCVAISIGISGLVEAAAILFGTTIGATTLGTILYRVLMVAFYAIISKYGIECLLEPLRMLKAFLTLKFGGFISSKLFKKASETSEDF